MKTKDSVEKSLSSAKNPLPMAKDLYGLLTPYLNGLSLANLQATSRFFCHHITEEDWKFCVKKEISDRPFLLKLNTTDEAKNKTETYQAFYGRAVILMKEIQALLKSNKAGHSKMSRESIINSLNKLTMQAISLNWNCENFSKQVPALIFSSANINRYRTGFLNSTFLHEAARVGSHEFVAFLLSKRANVNPFEKGLFYSQVSSSGGLTSSHLSTGSAMNSVCVWLDNWGETPLMKASYEGFAVCADLLLQNGANINHACLSGGKTALHLAAKKGRYSSILLLIESGASLTAKNREGDTPLDCARDSGGPECITLIEDSMRKRGLEVPPPSRCIIC